MSASKLSEVDKAMNGVRARTRALVARKLAEGLPIASMQGSEMVVEQIANTAKAGMVSITVASTRQRRKAVRPGLNGADRLQRGEAATATELADTVG